MEETQLALVIQNPEQGEFLKRIDWNKIEFMELVSSIMEQYKGLVFTESQIKEAKAERARLNAMKKAISDKRIQIKKELMAPYDAFEAEVREVVALIDQPIAEIDSQIKAYEEQRRTEKLNALRQHFDSITEDLGGILDFDRIFDGRYLNTTVSLAKAKLEISDKVDRVRMDLKTIEALEPEYQIVVKDAYLRTLDTGKAFGEMYRLKELKAREMERLEREAAAKKQTASAAIFSETAAETPIGVSNQPRTAIDVPYAEAAPQPPTSPGQDFPKAQDPFTSQIKPKRYKASFTVYGTRDEIMAVRQYMIDNKIQFGKAEHK